MARHENVYWDDNGALIFSADAPPMFVGVFGRQSVPNAVVLALFAVDGDSRKRNVLLCAWGAVEVARAYARLQSQQDAA